MKRNASAVWQGGLKEKKGSISLQAAYFLTPNIRLAPVLRLGLGQIPKVDSSGAPLVFDGTGTVGQCRNDGGRSIPPLQ